MHACICACVYVHACICVTLPSPGQCSRCSQLSALQFSFLCSSLPVVFVLYLQHFYPSLIAFQFVIPMKTLQVSKIVPQMLNTSEGCVCGCWGSPSGSERWWREGAPHQHLGLVRDPSFQFSLCVLHAAPFCRAHSQFFWKQLVFSHRICEGRHFLCVTCISCFQTNISLYQGSEKTAGQHTGAAPNFHWCMQISYQWVPPPDWQDIEGRVMRGREGARLWVPTIPFLFWVAYSILLLTGFLLLYNFLFVQSLVFLTC